eukprot:4101074-Amphidinium_carterae.2
MILGDSFGTLGIGEGWVDPPFPNACSRGMLESAHVQPSSWATRRCRACIAVLASALCSSREMEGCQVAKEANDQHLLLV